MLQEYLLRVRQIAIAIVCAALAAAGELPTVRINASRLMNDIRYLSSPELGGRGTGTPGLDKAASWIAEEFARAGLKPVARDGYLQRFPITLNAVRGDNNFLRCEGCGERGTFELDADFVPLSFTGIGTANSSLVFAGYGITAPEYDYDDYAGIDARGKIVIILRHEPREYEDSDAFEGRVYTEHAQLLRKLLNAQDHGAAAVLFVSDMANHSGADTLEPVTPLAAPGRGDIPFVHVKASLVESWFAMAGRSFASAQAAIDQELRPHSFAFPETLRVTVSADVQSDQRMVANVAGYVPGTTPEYVILGAHYDHLGLGEQYSMAPDSAGTTHPGADDNASGTAAVVSLARWFASQPPMKRGVLFLAFAGEEIGLVGASQYTANPLLPLHDAAAMFNMDMIGRLRDRRLMVGGTATAGEFRPVLQAVGTKFPLELQMDENAVYGSSDHVAFTARQIPVLFFFTGLHADYHRPTDIVERIDRKGTVSVVELIGTVAGTLIQQPDRPRFAFWQRSERTAGRKNIPGVAPGVEEDSDESSVLFSRPGP